MATRLLVSELVFPQLSFLPLEMAVATNRYHRACGRRGADKHKGGRLQSPSSTRANAT